MLNYNLTREILIREYGDLFGYDPSKETEIEENAASEEGSEE